MSILDLKPWTPSDVSPPCAGLWTLFESTTPSDHREARKICSTCPIRVTCLERAKSEPQRLGVAVGTWGGKLFGAAGRERRDAA